MRAVRALIRLVADKLGATAIEYAFVASLISIAGASVFITMGTSLSSIFSSVASSF
jgi:Flp pilus assembly pilin Flp